MSKLTADQFKSACHAVRQLTASLAGCLDHEVAAEAARLRTAINDLCHAEPRQRSKLLIHTRRSAIEYAHIILARRGA